MTRLVDELGLCLGTVEELLRKLDARPKLLEKAASLCRLPHDPALGPDDLIHEMQLDLTRPEVLERLRDAIASRLLRAANLALIYRNADADKSDPALRLSQATIDDLLEKLNILDLLHNALATPQAVALLQEHLRETLGMVAQRSLLRVWFRERKRWSSRLLLRKEHRQDLEETDAGMDARSPEAAAQTEELWEGLSQLLETDEQRQLLDLRFRQSKSHEQIGEILGILPQASRWKTHRMLKVLKERSERCVSLFGLDTNPVRGKGG